MYDIYSNAHDDQWRFTLGRCGSRPLLTIGLNPSTATQERADPTVAQVERIAEDKGFDGFVMLNLYPVRATDFRELPADRNELAFTTNLGRIEATVARTSKSMSKPMIWAAWGESILHHDFFIDACVALIRRLRRHHVQWVHFGEITKSGHPRHPSRVTYAWKFSKFDADSYLEALPSTA